MFFQKLVQQHRVHCFIANGAEFAVFVTHD
jgi:hypothetical protein